MTTELIAQLRRDEGVRARMYVDTVGKRTIGVGHNLDDKPISDAAVMQILADDISDVQSALGSALPWVNKLDAARQGVLLNMAFNMGVAGLLAFKTTLALIQSGRYDDAADEMLNSKWARQVGERARRLSRQMRTGQWA